MHNPTEPQQSQMSVSQNTSQNSPIAYGLGSFGLESLYTVFVGFYMFYYIDELGLPLTMAKAEAMALDCAAILREYTGIGLRSA
jgi:hypothetical protein